MGLDISAYSRLKPIGMHDMPDDWCDEDDHIMAYAYSSFPQSFRGIPILGERDRFILGGCYMETDETETIGFRAGSYGGYGQWRQDLAEQFNTVEIDWENVRPTMTEPDPSKPFYELIWFADNEGSIGPEAAAELLKDFREHADAYRLPLVAHSSYSTLYQNWTRAFELAADGGLVRFH